MELRCPNRKFAELVRPATSEGSVEFICRSRRCGHMAGAVIVLHTFSVMTGTLMQTRQFRQPKGGLSHDPTDSASVRSS